MELQNFNNSQTMSSREIAQLTGKEHRSVLRDIDNLNDNYEKLGLHKIVQSSYFNEQGREFREMLLSKIQTMDLMTGYNVELRIKVNRRWEELENKNVIDFSDPNTVLMLATNWKNEKDRADKLQIENVKLDLKTQFVDKVFDSKQNITLSQSAKLLKLPFGRNIMAKELRARGIFFKNSNEPKQTYIDRGYFMIFPFFNESMSKPSNQTFVTQKGLAFLAKVFEVIVPKNQIIKFQ